MSNVFVFRRPPHGVITEYFGGGKGGSTTTTNNVTQIPPEVLARYNAVNARAESVASQPYQKYSDDPNAFVAPLSQTQQAGIQNTNAMAGAAQPYYGAATGLAAQSTGSVNPSALNVGQYMNPYTQSVVNATQAAMNQQQGQQLSQQQAEAIKGGAFGGERAGLQRAQLMGQQGLAQAQAIAPLYQQNYNQALAAAQQQQGVGLGAEQANRQNLQNAAQLFGSIGTNAQQAGLAGAQAQLAAGQTQQQTQQAGLQAMYNQFQQQQGFPYQQAQFLANIAEGTGALSGNATSGTSTTQGGGGFFSDERLKENIQRVGETDDGQPIYRYNYKGDKNTQIGLLAQDVEKHHPEAVGLAGGYKTVNYKKATEDAIHKEDGGGISGTDAYLIKGPSAMLQENSGKGLGAMPSLPQAFQGGRDIPIETGANAAGLAAMRSPAVTGFAPGVREGKQAELDTLLSAPSHSGPDGAVLGSGPGYVSSRINTLQDWLNQNNSQGGLVGPQGGSFARGGLADGGYMNPALQYYAPNKGDLMAMGPYGVAPRQSQQRGLLQGTKFDRPQQQPQRNPIDEATKIGQLGSGASSAWGARPDFLRSKEDIAARANTAAAIKAKEDIAIAQAKGLAAAPTPAKAEAGGDDYARPEEGDAAQLDMPVESYGDFPEVYAARGGLIGDRHHYSRGGINPYGGLGGGNDILGPVLEDQEQQPQPQMMKAPEASGQKPQQKSGGLGELVDTGLKARSLYKGGEWAAGKLGLTGPETAMSATSTEALPGVIGAAVPATETAGVIGAAAPEALTAAIPETVASAAEFLPMLFGIPLKDGGVVPRHHYATTGSVPENFPDRVPEGASSRFGTDVGQPMTEEEKANALIKQLAGQTIAEKAPLMERRPITPSAPVEASAEPVAKPVRPSLSDTAESRAPYRYAMSSILPDDMSPGTKAALTSENLWVPALAGIGSMLASPNKTLAGAIGSGLVGGTTAYTGLQKQQAETDKAQAETGLTKAQTSRARIFIEPTTNTRLFFYTDPKTGEERSMRLIDALGRMEKGETFGLEPSEVNKIRAEAGEIVGGQRTTEGAVKGNAGAGTTAAGTTAAGTTSAGTTVAGTTAAPAPAKDTTKVEEKVPAVAPGELSGEDAKLAEDWRKESRDRPASWLEANKDIYTPQQEAAKGSSEFKSQLFPMAASLAGQPRTGVLAVGPLRDIFVPIAKYVNQVANVLQFPEGPIDSAKLANAEEGRKYVQRLREAAAAKGDFKAVSALSAIEKGYVSDTNTTKGIAKLLAGMSVETQRDIDKNDYFQAFKRQAESGDRDALSANRSGSWAGLDARFDKSRDPIYQDDKKALERMYLEGIPVTENGKQVWLARDGKKISREDIAAGRAQPMTVGEWLLRDGAKLSDAEKKWVVSHYGPRSLRYFGLGN